MPMVRKVNCLGTETISVISVSTSLWCAHRSLAHAISIQMGCLCMFTCLFCIWSSNGFGGNAVIFPNLNFLSPIMTLDIKQMFKITFRVQYERV